MFHCLYINNDVEYEQLVLPQVYHTAVLQTIHDDYGPQGLDGTLSLYLAGIAQLVEQQTFM